MKIYSPNILPLLDVSGSLTVTGSINFIDGEQSVRTLSAGNLVTTESLAGDLPEGIVSGSSQISYTEITDIPVGIVSGSQQITLANITGRLFANDTYTFPSNIILSGSTLVQRAEEKITISATAATGTVNYDVLTQPVLYYTSNTSGNWTLNLRGNAFTTLNNSMEIGRALTVVFMVTNGSTPYRQTGFQIDGSNVTPKWQGGTAPSAGNANSVDSYSIVIMKTGNATFSVFEALTRFA
jgi:hypothetical protein